jgi:hypothetical protein
MKTLLNSSLALGILLAAPQGQFRRRQGARAALDDARRCRALLGSRYRRPQPQSRRLRQIRLHRQRWQLKVGRGEGDRAAEYAPGDLLSVTSTATSNGSNRARGWSASVAQRGGHVATSWSEARFQDKRNCQAGAGGAQYHRGPTSPRHPRERGDPELGADRRFDSTRAVLRGVALGCPRTRRVRGQNNNGICSRGYSGPQTVVYSG